MAASQEITYLWKMIYDCFTADVPLTTALGHTVANKHIGRVGQRKKLGDPCITFGQQVMGNIADNDQPRILTLREVYFLISSFSINSDMTAADNSELALQAIVGEVLSESNFKTNPIEWDNFSSAPYYDENEQAYRVDVRIKIIIKYCSS